MTLRMLAPIFSKTNEESPSRTNLCSRALVSESRKRLCSRFSVRTSSSIWLRSCSLLRCWSERRQLFRVRLRCGRILSASCSRGIRLVFARQMMSSFREDVFVAQFFASVRLFCSILMGSCWSRNFRNLLFFSVLKSSSGGTHLGNVYYSLAGATLQRTNR